MVGVGEEVAGDAELGEPVAPDARSVPPEPRSTEATARTPSTMATKKTTTKAASKGLLARSGWSGRDGIVGGGTNGGKGSDISGSVGRTPLPGKVAVSPPRGELGRA